MKIQGLASRLQKGRPAVQVQWADLTQALASNPAATGWVTSHHAIVEADHAALSHQAAVMAISPQAMLLGAARLLIARYLPDEVSCSLAWVDGARASGHVAVPLASPGRQVVTELLGDCEGWLQRPKRTTAMDARIIVRTSNEGSAVVEAMPSLDRQLSLCFEVRATGVDIEAVAAASVFSQPGLDDFLEQLGHVVRQLATLPGQASLDGVDVLPGDQRARLIDTWGRLPSSAQPALVLPHLAFEAQAASQPDAVALVCGPHTMSYGELNRRANQVAHGLLARGVHADDRVALCVERGFEMVVGLLGVLKSGAAYVPLDPTYPAERLAYMLQDCSPAVVLTQSALLQHISVPGVPLLALDEHGTEITGHPVSNPQGVAHGFGHLAYVIYTSGSTGKPKGACVDGLGVSNLLHWYVDALKISPADRFLVVTSFSFDLTQKNILAPLCEGAQVCLSAHRFDPSATLAEIAQRGITALNLTPSYFYALAECDSGYAMSSLRYAVLGGEPISPARLAQSQSKYPELQFINSYGPTECSDVVAAFSLGRNAVEPGASSPPVGHPIPQTRLYVLDAKDRLAPAGVVGEIHVAGAGVGRGYLHQAELTNQRFVDDPFCDTGGTRMYRTGDLGRWRSDGHLEYLGRNDSQVKLRGFRIELGEIEAQLATCPGVRDAAVHCHDDGEGGKQLVAYLVGHAGVALSEGQVRERLAQALPEFMVPGVYVPLAALPLTPSGKVDRRALPAPQYASGLARAYEAPSTASQSLLCDIWQTLFRRERIGVVEDFFEIGGHSLLATRLLAAIAERMHVTLPITAVFEHKTIRAQALLVDAAPPQQPQAHLALLPLTVVGAEREEFVL